MRNFIAIGFAMTLLVASGTALARNSDLSATALLKPGTVLRQADILEIPYNATRILTQKNQAVGESWLAQDLPYCELSIRPAGFILRETLTIATITTNAAEGSLTLGFDSNPHVLGLKCYSGKKGKVPGIRELVETVDGVIGMPDVVYTSLN